MRLRLILLIFLILTTSGKCFAAQQIQCDDFRGVRYGVYNSPALGGQVVIAPVMGAKGPELPMTISNNPLVLMGYTNSFGFSVLIARDGSFVVSQGLQFSPLGKCAVVEVGINVLPLPPGSILGINQRVTEPIIDSNGTDVTDISERGVGSDTGEYWPMDLSTDQAADCSNRYGVNQTSFIHCLTTRMLTKKQVSAIRCAYDSDQKIEQAGCIAKLADRAATKLIGEIQTCVADNKIDTECVAKGNLTPQQYAAYSCVRDGTSTSEVDSCVNALGLDSDTFRVTSALIDCYSQGADTEDFAVCALNQSGNKTVAAAAKCVQQQTESADFSYVGAGVCYAGDALGLNPELRIAAECVVESGGQPYAYAGCVGGRLVVREISKCFTEGVGEEGCFGKNNEILKTMRAAGIDLTNMNNPNGEVIKAWNTVTKDFRDGPGPNNDLVHFATQATNDLVHGPGPNNTGVVLFKNIVSDATNGPGPNNELVKAINATSGGINHLGGQATNATAKVFGW